MLSAAASQRSSDTLVTTGATAAIDTVDASGCRQHGRQSSWRNRPSAVDTHSVPSGVDVGDRDVDLGDPLVGGPDKSVQSSPLCGQRGALGIVLVVVDRAGTSALDGHQRFSGVLGLDHQLVAAVDQRSTSRRIDQRVHSSISGSLVVLGSA